MFCFWKLLDHQKRVGKGLYSLTVIQKDFFDISVLRMYGYTLQHSSLFLHIVAIFSLQLKREVVFYVFFRKKPPGKDDWFIVRRYCVNLLTRFSEPFSV